MTIPAKESPVRDKHLYLMQYVKISKAQQSAEEKFERIGDSYLLKSPILSDMPKSTKIHDLSDIVAKRDELARALCKLEYERLTMQIDIIKRITALRDVDEQRILTLKYIEGRKEWEIADILSYSDKTIQRKKNLALLHF